MSDIQESIDGIAHRSWGRSSSSADDLRRPATGTSKSRFEQTNILSMESLCSKDNDFGPPVAVWCRRKVEKMFHTFSRHWRRKSLKWTVQRGAGIRTRRIEVNVFCVRRPTVVMRKWLPFDLNHLHVYVSHLINVMSHANISIESANIKDITGCRLVPLLLLLFFLFFFANLQSTCLSKSAYKFK